MKKAFAVTLKSIEYLGDPIGNDIFLEIEAGAHFLKYDKKIQHGAKTDINQEVGYFETEENNVQVLIRVKITEKDILFDDSGNVKGLLKIDLLLPLPQSQTFEIKVSENRGVSSKRGAIFRVVLEAAAAIRYVEDVDQQGWLKVLPLSGKEDEIFSIPMYLKIQVDGKDEAREYFSILEGVLKNTKASIKLKEGGSSRFSKNNPHKKAVNLTYSISKKTLKLGRKTYKTTDYPEAPWTKGTYDIEIPDYPHELGLRHIDTAPHATTWFRINYEKDRYIHTGGVSLGCITLTEKNRWDELYLILISARKGDDINIGIFTVVD